MDSPYPKMKFQTWTLFSSRPIVFTSCCYNLRSPTFVLHFNHPKVSGPATVKGPRKNIPSQDVNLVIHVAQGSKEYHVEAAKLSSSVRYFCPYFFQLWVMVLTVGIR